MITKSILAVSAVAAAIVAFAPAAEAHHKKHHIYLNIGIGDPGPGYYDPPPPPPRRPRYVYEDPDFGYPGPGYDEEDYGLSCGQGRRIVRNSGFYNVSTIECDGQNYKYDAERRGRSYVVKVDSRNGAIIAANRY